MKDSAREITLARSFRKAGEWAMENIHMGLFNWFANRRRIKTLPDTFWATKAAKLNGIAQELIQCRPFHAVILVIAHFPATLVEVRSALRRHEVEHEVGNGPLNLSDLRGRQQGSCRVMVVAAESLRAGQGPSRHHDHDASFCMLVAEHYPLRAKDEMIETCAEAMGEGSLLHFHASAEDPVLSVFAGAVSKALLEWLGFKGTDAISDPRLTKSIRRAQQKVEQQASGDRPADSAENWFRHNCPALWPD